MNHVARLPAEQEKDEPERNEDNAYKKAPDQNVGKDFRSLMKLGDWLFGRTLLIGFKKNPATSSDYYSQMEHLKNRLECFSCALHGFSFLSIRYLRA
jgi:hypothetical protein